MFSKKHDRQNDHSDDTQDKFEGTPDIDELESNLQPIDMSVFDRVSTGSHLPGDTADAAPAGDRIDMGAVAALNTSQFLASAVNAAAAEKGVESEDDPFALKHSLSSRLRQPPLPFLALMKRAPMWVRPPIKRRAYPMPNSSSLCKTTRRTSLQQKALLMLTRRLLGPAASRPTPLPTPVRTRPTSTAADGRR